MAAQLFCVVAHLVSGDVALAEHLRFTGLHVQVALQHPRLFIFVHLRSSKWRDAALLAQVEVYVHGIIIGIVVEGPRAGVGVRDAI